MLENSSSDEKPATYNGKPLAHYDNWIPLPGGFAATHPRLKGQAGLYRALRNGEVIFIGKGAGVRARLYERLQDLRRPGDSGRRYPAGHYIHDHMGELELQVAIIGSDRAARELTGRLLRPMIQLYRPRLNVDLGYINRKIRASYAS